MPRHGYRHSHSLLLLNLKPSRIYLPQPPLPLNRSNRWGIAYMVTIDSMSYDSNVGRHRLIRRRQSLPRPAELPDSLMVSS